MIVCNFFILMILYKTKERDFFMKRLFGIFGLIGSLFLCEAADAGRGVLAGAPTATSRLRGNAGVAEAYKANQRNVYFMVNQPDVDTACRQKIYACLSEYCGDTTIIPGQRTSKCQYVKENELYNYALLCLQKDTEILLPQYNTNTVNGKGGMNTAARLCPSYIQQEIMSYMSMMNMATQLTKSNSDLCFKRRQELEAAMSCHSVAMEYSNETDSKLKTMLTDYCGAGVPGGSAEMVTRFANAGSVGADILGWAEKIVNLEFNSRGEDWIAATNAVLASYANRMNLACGDNLQLNTVSYSDSDQPSTLQSIALLAIGASSSNTNKTENPYEYQPIWMEVTSMSNIWDYDSANDIINAVFSNSALTQNAFFTPAQMDDMHTAYKRGTRVFVIHDNARCYILPVAPLTPNEESLVAQKFANCLHK